EGGGVVGGGRGEVLVGHDEGEGLRWVDLAHRRADLRHVAHDPRADVLREGEGGGGGGNRRVTAHSTARSGPGDGRRAGRRGPSAPTSAGCPWWPTRWPSLASPSPCPSHAL